MSVVFEVGGRPFALPERQATILAENLRILSKADFEPAVRPPALAGSDEDWPTSAMQLADSIESVLVAGDGSPLKLEGGSAAATYCVLRVMVGVDVEGARGLRNALGGPVERQEVRPATARSSQVQLSRAEMLELLVILFVLAVLTVVAGVAWTGTWYILTPVIAGLLGLRVATTRASGRFAWTFASVLWFGVLLVPAGVLVALLGLLTIAILRN